MSILSKYLEKKNTIAIKLDLPPNTDLKYIIVIPCYNEDKVINTLESLNSAIFPNNPLEIIIVINSPESAPAQIIEHNRRTQEKIREWNKKHSNARFRVHTINLEHLPEKDAGPGLARKIGMDAAIRRFHEIEKDDGYIISLDADSLVSKNYFQAIEEAISKNEKLNAGIIYFEHPVNGTTYKPKNYEAVAHYELFLRYYNMGLNYCGFPYPFHTIGSAFFVSARAYAKQGGMNKRKAGEDFYFLNKIFQLGNIQELNSNCVMPSPRPSDRVLFGTGQVVSKLSKAEEIDYLVYNPKYFNDLRILFKSILSQFFKEDSDRTEHLLKQLPLELMNFLKENNFRKELNRLKNNCASERTFRKQFFHWFNGLKIIQFMHYVHPDENKKVSIKIAASQMLEYHGYYRESNNIFELLSKYREIERSDETAIH